MSGGKISGNTVKLSGISTDTGGGGVAFGLTANTVLGTFEMTGGEISGNTVIAALPSTVSYGGGVFLNAQGFIMAGGSIAGNTVQSLGTADRLGGGVYIKAGVLIKGPAAAIYGFDLDSGAALRNIAFTDGHAVYVETGPKVRNTTAGIGVTLNTGLSGAAGGWQ
jgi:prepilin-type processing-associated H-X9-DG protein